MMYEPLTLPPIRRSKKSKIKSSEMNMDLEAIRARRTRLEALTLAMRTRSVERLSSLRHNDVHMPRVTSFSASKMRRQHREPNVSASKSIKLEPLNRVSPDMGTGVLDKYGSNDPLLRRGSSQEASTPKPGSPNLNTEEMSELECEDFDRPPGEAEETCEDSSKDPVLAEILEQLASSDESTKLQGARAARERVSDGESDCVDRYVAAGILPPLLALFDKDHNPELQFESLWAITNIAAGKNEHTKAVVDANGLPGILRLLSSPHEKVALQAVWAVSNITGDNAAMRDRVVEAGLVPILLQLVHRYQTVEAQRIISWTLSNLLRFKPVGMTDDERLMCLHALQPYLNADDDAVRVDAARGLEFASDGSDAHIRQVLQLDELPTIIGYLDSADYRLVQVGAKIIGNIVSGDDELTEQVVQAGAIPPLVSLLRDDEESIRKEAAWALSNILAGTTRQIKEAMKAGALAELLYILEDPEETLQVGREACWCLSNICNGGSEDTVDEIVIAGTVSTMLAYLGKHPDDHNLATLLLMACKEAVKRTTQTAVLRQSLSYAEVEQLLTPLIGAGNESASSLWIEMKTKVFSDQ